MASRISCAVIVAALVGPGTGACIAPVSLGSPERSRTVGQGQVGLSGRLELPSINLISGGTTKELHEEGFVAPIAGGDISFGVHDRVDLEAGVEVPLYLFILPIPNGVWAGARVGLVENDDVEVAASGRVGGVALGEVEGDIETDESASASYGSAGLSVSANTGTVLRPGMSLRYTSYDVSTEGVDDAAANFGASVASANVYLEARFDGAAIVPYLNFASFASPNLNDGRASIFGAGIALRITPGDARRTPQPLVQPPPPMQQPQPMHPQQPPMYPQPPPQPMQPQQPQQPQQPTPQ